MSNHAASGAIPAANTGIDRIIFIIDQISIWTGKATAWLIIPMAGVLVYEVFMRKVFSPWIYSHDIATQLYGTHFLLTAAFCLYLGKHIRTDLFFDKWSPYTQAWVDFVCYITLFMPGMLLFLYLGWDFAAESWDLHERLLTPGRPPAYFYKSMLPLGTALLTLQGVSEMLKSYKVIKKGRQQ
ncbi:MAG: TRAP transporter small permease subunit [Syntrophobacteraceae bacterium]